MEIISANGLGATEQLSQLSQKRSECVITIEKKLNKVQQYAAGKPWEKWCIYQVPRRLRDAQEDPKVYEPQIVSIGPHHPGSDRVQDMDFHKMFALHQVLERTGKDLNSFVESIKEVEEQARACYKQHFDLTSDKFVEMMVFDGCFILELFRCYLWVKENGNPVFSDRRIISDILLDLIMLENQIPLFVIDRLLKLICTGDDPGEHQKDQAKDLVLCIFNSEWLTGISISQTEFDELKSLLHQKNCLHILDVFRQSLLYKWDQHGAIHKPSFQRRVCDKLVPTCLKQLLQANTSLGKKSRRGQVIHRVADLRGAGVKFKIRNSNCFWDIRFRNGVLEIPKVRIQGSTKTILLNVVTFEHCHLKISDAITASYVVFMECLIKSPEDVGHLHHCGIIQHVLGSDAEVVDMFKSISKEIILDADGGHYAELSRQVNAYYSQRRNRWRASLLQKYFNNPWVIISLVAACILLILTAVQTFYAVYSYYKPN